MSPRTYDNETEILMESSTPYENKAQKPPISTSRWTLKLICLIFYAHCIAVIASIRYGFLADSFSKRHVPGKIYGFIEGSMFIGFAACFITRAAESLMKKINSKYLMMGYQAAFALTSIATGLIYQIENNMTVIILSTILRIVQGAISYAACLAGCDFISAQFPEKFDLVNGLLSLGYYTGHGVAESIGCVLYSEFGYMAPYILSTGMGLLCVLLVLLIIPKDPTYCSTQEKENTSTTETSVKSSDKLSVILILPMVATMLINSIYGVLQVTVTPYLHVEFSKSIAYGGGVLTFVSIGMAIGSVSSGFLLQQKLITTYAQMAFGAFLVAAGLFITFPPQSLTAFYNMSPITAFPGVFLAGIGDPMMTVATLRAMFELQLTYCHKLTPKNVTLITGIWLLGYNGFYYAGSFIAGILTDIMSYCEIAEILSGCCLISITICVALRCLVRQPKGTDEEKVPLISGH